MARNSKMLVGWAAPTIGEQRGTGGNRGEQGDTSHIYLDMYLRRIREVSLNFQHYKKDCDECGSKVACRAYWVCLNSFDTFWFNCVRGCLKEKYLSRSNDYIWLFVDHPICYAACPPM